ncbi:unnamed protein product [Phytophthora lilii]|uniref:Unnamed protein product n=1 Tax=Phytophthora lilii TaxID=2077276 RepID=A0A9W6TM59_9STRA|nr:unnamed protein product [Phytophthora lilii]
MPSDLKQKKPAESRNFVDARNTVVEKNFSDGKSTVNLCSQWQLYSEIDAQIHLKHYLDDNNQEQQQATAQSCQVSWFTPNREADSTHSNQSSTGPSAAATAESTYHNDQIESIGELQSG